MPDSWEWPLRRYWIDLAWGVFAALNLVAMIVFPDWETVPFHFIWVSLTVLYGFRVWRPVPTALTLTAVMAFTAAFIGIDVARNHQPIDEITEVPLMAAMFLAMVWHARRRLAALDRTREVSDSNLRLLERERRFLQDASHELRTPITVALGHVELIGRTAEEPAIRADAEVAVDELMRLRRLADRLLLLASSEHPDFLHRTPVDAADLVADAMRRWSATARSWVQGPAERVLIDADADRAALAIDSLIENAVKHTAPEERIELSALREGAWAVIRVGDSGPGIPSSEIEHIFDRFRRVDASRSREGGGVGLGLAIVRAIAEAHGGCVGVVSGTDGGTVFELKLPVSNGPRGALP